MTNEWTSNDVPSVSSLDLCSKRPDLAISGKHFGAAVAFEAMVEHLNKVHPKPAPASREDAALADRLERQATSIARLQGELETAERDRSRWRRAHGIVEQERYQARAELAEVQVERDSWRDRAEAAETRTERLERGIRAFVRHGQAVPRGVTTYDRGIVHAELLALVDAEKESAPARAEAAEARTAPAVTRDDIGNALMRVGVSNGVETHAEVSVGTDAVWSLVSGADPAVFVMRESQLPEVVACDEGTWKVGRRTVTAFETPERLREFTEGHLKSVAELESMARKMEILAVEAGQATDPVEERVARIIAHAALDWADLDADGHKHGPECSNWEPYRDEARQVLAHVLGQEAGR